MEVIDPAMTIKVIGFLNGGQRLYKGRFNFNQMKGIYSRLVVNKIKDTIINGQKNSVYIKSPNLIKSVGGLYTRFIAIIPNRYTSYDINQQRSYHICNIRAIKRIGPHNNDLLL